MCFLFSISENDDVELRRPSRHLRHAQSEVPSYLSFEDHRRCSQSLTDAKEHAYARLKEELTKAQQVSLPRYNLPYIPLAVETSHFANE